MDAAEFLTRALPHFDEVFPLDLSLLEVTTLLGAVVMSLGHPQAAQLATYPLMLEIRERLAGWLAETCGFSNEELDEMMVQEVVIMDEDVVL